MPKKYKVNGVQDCPDSLLIHLQIFFIFIVEGNQGGEPEGGKQVIDTSEPEERVDLLFPKKKSSFPLFFLHFPE